MIISLFDLGQTGTIVSQLPHHFLDKDYSLFVDHYHNFVALDIYLAKRSTYIGGNLHSDRKGNIHALTLVTVEFVWRRSGNVVICKWKDKRDVLPINNKNTNSEMFSVSNRLGDPKQVFAIIITECLV